MKKRYRINKDCVLCAFENPKLTVTAIAIKDQKLLVAKRAEEPFRGQRDFIGGYVQKNETPEQALRREIKEELGVGSRLTYISSFTGTATHQEFKYPVLSLAYLVELDGPIKLNKKENSHIAWVPLKKLPTIAFDSNQKILKFVKDVLNHDLKRIKDLTKQLDSSAEIDEYALYKAMFSGYLKKIEIGGRLIGMGWIFPRQTMLRHQAVVEDMIVDENHRGKGLGKKILKDLIRWAKKQGIQVIELTTNPKRVAANKLYQKVGFKLHETNHYLLKLK